MVQKRLIFWSEVDAVHAANALKNPEHGVVTELERCEDMDTQSRVYMYECWHVVVKFENIDVG